MSLVKCLFTGSSLEFEFIWSANDAIICGNKIIEYSVADVHTYFYASHGTSGNAINICN